MTEYLTRPRRIEWAGPEGWTIWADEDGVHLRTPGGNSLEQPDVLRLIELYTSCRASVATNDIKAPTPSTREQIHEMGFERRAAYDAKIAARAVAEAINPTVVPF